MDFSANNVVKEKIFMLGHFKTDDIMHTHFQQLFYFTGIHIQGIL